MAVVVENLVKHYGNVAAVEGISLAVPTGALFALLGENGAGKSTTISCITTTLKPTSGRIEVAGVDVVRHPLAVRSQIGVVFQQSLLDPLLTVAENLDSRARLYGLGRQEAKSRILELTDRFGIGELLRRRYRKLSGGQRRKVDIARALLHRPRILFLDEPTAGLDPKSREAIWATVDELRAADGVTVFLTTHYLEETERADTVAIIQRGRVLAEGTPGALRALHSSSVLTATVRDPASFEALSTRIGLRAERISADTYRIEVPDALSARQLLNELDVVDFEFRHGTMDDVFLHLTAGARS